MGSDGPEAGEGRDGIRSVQMLVHVSHDLVQGCGAQRLARVLNPPPPTSTGDTDPCSSPKYYMRPLPAQFSPTTSLQTLLWLLSEL